jgi:hypothetical protein
MKINVLTDNTLSQPGKRVTGSMHPQIAASSTYNQFVINEKGRELLDLGVEKGIDNANSRAFLFDFGKVDNGIRFLITKGFYGKGELYGAKLGLTYGFTYSPRWGAIMAANPKLEGAKEVTEISIDDMNRLGIFADVERQIAAFKCVMDIVPVYMDAEDELTLDNGSGENKEAYLPIFTTPSKEQVPVTNINGNEEPVQIFALVNPNYVKHDPKSESDDEFTAEVVDEVNGITAIIDENPEI